MIEHIRQYYLDERSGGSYALIAAVIFIGLGIFIWIKFSANPLSKGMATGFLAISLLLFTAGFSTRYYNNRKIAGLSSLSGQTNAVLQQSELQRMDKVMNVTFRYAFITFGILMLVSVAATIFVTNYYWKGLSISLMLLVALLIISDSFSMQRNKAYQATIEGFKP